MRVAIVGSREGVDLERVRRFVRTLPKDVVVVSGGARGVDAAAESEAKRCGLKVVVLLARWKQYGRSAGFRRNEELAAYLEKGDRLVAFWNGVSNGTRHVVECVQRRGISVEVLNERSALSGPLPVGSLR